MGQKRGRILPIHKPQTKTTGSTQRGCERQKDEKPHSGNDEDDEDEDDDLNVSFQRREHSMREIIDCWA